MRAQLASVATGGDTPTGGAAVGGAMDQATPKMEMKKFGEGLINNCMAEADSVIETVRAAANEKEYELTKRVAT